MRRDTIITAVQVRDAERRDAADIAAIGRVEFPRLHTPLMGEVATRSIVDQIYTEAAVADSIARCRDDENAHFLVAERDGNVVGYLHYDSFGAEPELHRIYLAAEAVGLGTGGLLIEELHSRLAPGTTYILLVAAANNGARRFYKRHGLVEERVIADGNELYRDNMGVVFPPEAEVVPAVVMRWTKQSPATGRSA